MIILGSSSPRRIEYIKKLNLNYITIVPSFDEKSISSSFRNDYSIFLASKKMESILNNKDFSFDKDKDLILTLDTSIVKNNTIYNKPINYEEAKKFLNIFSNSSHEVITGICVYYQNKIYKYVDKSIVNFNKLSNELIEKYIKEVNVYDKAGGYGIQYDDKYHLIKNIEGSYSNIVGFPLEKIKNILIELNYKQ